MKTSPKDFFLQLGAIVALYVGAGALINLIFTILDVVFPNQNFYSTYYGSPISWPVAILIIVFPIFVLLTWLLNRDFRMAPEKKALGIRKWLLYVTLFVSGGVIAGDLITLLYRFLSGEIITTGFILKVFAIFIIAAGIFGYYISDLRDKTSPARNRIYAIVLGVIILALIVWGFAIFGSPAKQRKLRVDSQKISDLQGIQWQIVTYWQQKQVMPQNLDALTDPISNYAVPKDSETGLAYEYKRTGEKNFELCAIFNLASNDTKYSALISDRSTPISYPENMGSVSENWKHAAGRTCFERTIDAELYPPRKNQPSAI